MQVIFIIFNCQTPELDKSANVCLVHLYTLEGAIHDTEYKFQRISKKLIDNVYYQEYYQ